VLCTTAVEELFRPNDPSDRQKSGDGRLVWCDISPHFCICACVKVESWQLYNASPAVTCIMWHHIMSNKQSGVLLYSCLLYLRHIFLSSSMFSLTTSHQIENRFDVIICFTRVIWYVLFVSVLWMLQFCVFLESKQYQPRCHSCSGS